MPLRTYVGYDYREDLAARVCEYSLQKHSSKPLLIERIDRQSDGYSRPSFAKGNQLYDARDGRPFSTAFTFARFLVPHLQEYEGWALFCDCDFLFQADVAELFEMRDESKAVQVVQHMHFPSLGVKMDGQNQAQYPRKNWSSLILWNCSHPSNRALTSDVVNHMPGRMLHGFKWLEDHEIGSLPMSWNVLAGYTDKRIRPKAIHYTEGGPWFKDHEQCEYADEWNAARGEYDAQMKTVCTVEDTHAAAG